MCGIYGCIGNDFNKIRDAFSSSLSNRGPDGEGFFMDSSNPVSLGHTRLSIIDLSNRASQPMKLQDNNYIIVFNGEIYNYQEIKTELEKKGHQFKSNSDTETVLRSYMQHGVDCLKRFRGMFAFAIYNRSNQEMFLARDRFGIKPLIYTTKNGNFYFSSELKPLLKMSSFHPAIDKGALLDLLRFGSVQQPTTIFENVFHLEPGHYMTVSLNLDKKITKYYDFVNASLKRNVPTGYKDGVVLTRQILEEATKYHLIADVPVGAFLSGGVDSTSVVALMNQYSRNKISTYSVGFETGAEVEDESVIARDNARLIGTDHHDIVVDNQFVGDLFPSFINSVDQPSIDGINTFIVSKVTSETRKVALSGLGGDEIFAGYKHFGFIQNLHARRRNVIVNTLEKLDYWKTNRYTRKLRAVGISPEDSIQKFRTIMTDGMIEKFTGLNYPSNIRSDTREDLSILQRISKVEMEKYLVNTLLRDADVLSMSHSLEVRPILLDHVLLETVFAFNDDFKIRNGIRKSVFIDAVKDLIPEQCWMKKKTGFEMPIKTWLNTSLIQYFDHAIHSSHAKDLLRKDTRVKLEKDLLHRNIKRGSWIWLVLFNWLDENNLSL